MPGSNTFHGMLLDFRVEIRSYSRLEVGQGTKANLEFRSDSIKHNSELVFFYNAFSGANKNAKKYPNFHLRPTSNLLQLRI